MDCTIQQLQEYGTDMLRCVTELCEKHDIPYVMSYGSLLGTIRHKGPIPWDYDIDIWVPNPRIPEFVEVMNWELPEKYWVDYRVPGQPKKSFPRIGIKGYTTRGLHIDVYRVIGFPESFFKQKFMRYALRILMRARAAKEYKYAGGEKKKKAMAVRALTFLIPGDWMAVCFEKLSDRCPYDESEKIVIPGTRGFLPYEKSVFDSIRVPYADFEVRVPKEYDAMLTRWYGDYMKFPPEETRRKAMEKIYHIYPLKKKG